MSSQAIDQIVLVHGWGMEPSFWNPLVNALGSTSIRTLNLGYKGDVDTDPPNDQSLYITHSYGALWSLKNHAAQMSGLVIINGFTNFASFTKPRILKSMQARLYSEPEMQMQDFFKAIQHEDAVDGYNFENLRAGLECLSKDNAEEELKALYCPVLFLLGEDDPIVPVDIVSKQALGNEVKICEKGGHRLPLTDTQWCARQIKDFLK